MAVPSATEFVGGDGYGFVSDTGKGVYNKTASQVAIAAGVGGVSEYIFGTTQFVSPGDVVATNSVVSGVGFKAILGPAIFWTVSSGAAADMNSVVYNTATSTAQVAKFQWCAPFAGSILGLSLVLNNAIATTTCGVTINKNGTGVQTLNVTSPTLSGFSTYAKGANTFAAGDVLSFTIAFSVAATSVSVTAYAVVEMAA